jgi:hypothetical protein
MTTAPVPCSLALSSVLVALCALAPAAHAATAPPTRCDAPYDPASTSYVSARTMRASGPALRWLNGVYGSHAPQRMNVLREVAVRPCSISGRGAITIWTTDPPAMIRRAWRQPWIHRVDIQWVRVRFGSRDAWRAVRRATEPAVLAELEARLGPLAVVGDDPARDRVLVGVDTDSLPSDADEVANELLGVPAGVELMVRPSPA